MSKTNSHTTSTTTATQRPHSWTNIRRHPDQRQHEDPLNYVHPWPSMAEYAKRLALRTDAARTRHSYYRSMRLIHEHFDCDPSLISQDQLCDYILHVKTVKDWRPKTIRQTVACAKIFFVELLGHHDWTVFSQVKTKDHDELPPVLTRAQVHDLLVHIHIQPVGTGAAAIKYLGAYVARTAIGDSRIVKIDDTHVAFRWKDRASGGCEKLLTLDGVEFVRRFLRHVLPPKMHSVRHYGFCHPAAKKNRERVRFLTGMPLVIQDDRAQTKTDETAKPSWLCPCCGTPMRMIATYPRRFGREPPPTPPPDSS